MVTGATRKRGLGRAIALALARAGTDVAVTGNSRDPAKWEQRLSTMPIKRPGTVEEVADLVRYLCGPGARWISDDVLLMTGGEVRRAAR